MDVLMDWNTVVNLRSHEVTLVEVDRETQTSDSPPDSWTERFGTELEHEQHIRK